MKRKISLRQIIIQNKPKEEQVETRKHPKIWKKYCWIQIGKFTFTDGFAVIFSLSFYWTHPYQFFHFSFPLLIACNEIHKRFFTRPNELNKQNEELISKKQNVQITTHGSKQCCCLSITFSPKNGQMKKMLKKLCSIRWKNSSTVIRNLPLKIL